MWMLKYYNKKPVWLVLFIVCTLGIILVSLIPYSKEMSRQANPGFRWDYLEHFIAFFTFGSLYILWRSDRNFRIRSMELLILFLVAFSFSIGTEYAQLFIPGRAFNRIDMIYNLFGVLSSILLVYFYIIRQCIRKKHALIET